MTSSSSSTSSSSNNIIINFVKLKNYRKQDYGLSSGNVR